MKTIFTSTPPKKKKKGSISENNESISDFLVMIFYSLYSALFPNDVLATALCGLNNRLFKFILPYKSKLD